MMTMETWTCPGCHHEQAPGASPHHWNQFVADHLGCDDAATERAAAHDKKINASQEKWALRAISAAAASVFTFLVWLSGAFNPYELDAIWLTLTLLGCTFFEQGEDQ